MLVVTHSDCSYRKRSVQLYVSVYLPQYSDIVFIGALLLAKPLWLSKIAHHDVALLGVLKGDGMQ